MTAATEVTGGWKKWNILVRTRRAMTSTPCNTGTQIRPLSSRHLVQMDKSDGFGAIGSVRTQSRHLPWLAFRCKLFGFLFINGPKIHPLPFAVGLTGFLLPHLLRSNETIAFHNPGSICPKASFGGTIILALNSSAGSTGRNSLRWCSQLGRRKI
jgi:hypothetical protein